MSEHTLVESKKAATPTNAKPAIASPIHWTGACGRSSQSSVVPLPRPATAAPPSIQKEEDERNQHEMPDLQTQFEKATRFGHSFNQILMPRPQAKLTVGAPGDSYEQEADRVAEQVVATNTLNNPHPIQRRDQEQNEEEEQEQMKPLVGNITPLIQHQEELEPQEKLLLKQQGAATNSSSETSNNLESQLKATKSGGRPLPDSVRSFMETRIGANFGAVRLHTDNSAVQMSRDLKAQAFTHGNDIYFGAGKYSPESSDGKRLLAHELTHVVQQTGAKKIQRKPVTGLLSNQGTPALKSLLGSSIQLKQNPKPTQGAGKTNPVQKPISTSPAKPQGNQGGSDGTKPTSTQGNQGGSDGTKPTSNQGNQGGSDGTKPTSNQGNQGGSDGTKPASTQGNQGGSDATKLTSTQGNQGGSDGTKPTLGQKIKSGIATIISMPEGTQNADGAAESQDISGMEAPSDSTDQASGNDFGNGNASGKSPASPQEDQAFQSVVEKTKGAAANQQDHAPAQTNSKQAQDAAKGPANEVESEAQGRQVDEMAQQQPGTFDAASFKKALMDKIADAAPKNLKEADNFKNNNKIDSVKQDLSSQVSDQKKQAQDPIKNKTKEKPNTSGIEPKPVTPLPPQNPGPKPPDVDAAKAAPKPKSEAEVSLQAGSNSIDQKMTSSNLTDERLAKSNEPSFQSALEAKKKAQTDAVTAPAAYRQQEQGVLSQAQDQAQTTAQKHLEDMHSTREQSLSQVAGLQGKTKGQDEQQRTKVADHIKEIYNNTKQKVETCLSQLDGQVNKIFEDGATQTQKEFEDYVDKKMSDYKAQRYGGMWGWTRWIRDQFVGLPDEVNKFYEEGKQNYLDSMSKTIDQIADLVANQLNAAKAEIANGKQEVQKYVNSLPVALQQVGQEAAQNIQEQFDELDQEVDSKQDDLIENLAQKYNDKLKQLDDRIDEMKEQNKGLVQKAVEFVVGVVTTIVELAKMLVQVLARAASAIPAILKDPIGFVKNLFAGLNQGFQNFMKNIKQHLLDGLLGWLTGTLASNIQMPEKLDMEGIFSLVAQMLGLTYDAIRAKAVERLGEEKVSAMEKSFQMFQLMATQGVAGLWQFVKDKIGDLKSMVLDAIEQMVIQEVITAGIEWLLSMLSPASAFARACKAIIDVVEFFMSHAQQIADLINAIMDAVLAIANGSGLDQVAQLVENALAKAIPVVISFLASLLGLGDITEKVQGIINKARKPIDKAVDWVIDEGEKAVGSVGNKLGITESSTHKDESSNTKSSTPEAKSSITEPSTSKTESSTTTSSASKTESSTEQARSSTPKSSTPKAEPSTPKSSASSTAKSSTPKAGASTAKSSTPKAGASTAKSSTPKAGASTPEHGKKAEDQRTHENKNKDLADAKKTLQEVIAKSKSTEEVEQHFSAIKKNFGLKKLEWEKLGTPSAAIMMEINPKAVINLSGTSLLLNEGDTSHSDQFKQNVTFETDMLDGKYLVGKKMVATKLGPNHPQGSGPLGGALNLLMKLLPTDTGSANEEKYIKGHLLNDHIGGPGSAQNLYPITADANSKHEAYVEDPVKDWVNQQGFWVYYKVEVKEKHVDLTKGAKKGEVTADFVCEASKLDADGKHSLSGAIKRTIHSDFKNKNQPTFNKLDKSEYSDKAAQKDKKFDPNKVELSSRSAGAKPEELKDNLKEAISKIHEVWKEMGLNNTDSQCKQAINRIAIREIKGVNEEIKDKILMEPKLTFNETGTDLSKWNQTIQAFNKKDSDIVDKCNQYKEVLNKYKETLDDREIDVEADKRTALKDIVKMAEQFRTEPNIGELLANQRVNKRARLH